MATRYNDEPSSKEVDGALALIAEWDADDGATTPEAPEGVQPPPVYRRPERPRAANGRFASGEEATPEAEVPAEPLRRRQAAPPVGEQPAEAAAPVAGEDTTDYRAELARERAERTRLETQYVNNTRAQREALDAAKREADELRRGQAEARRQERESILTEYRQQIAEAQRVEAATGRTDPRIVPAERELLALERKYFEDERREAQEARQAAEAENETRTAQHADITAKSAAWTTVEIFAAGLGQKLNLHPEEVQGVIAEFQTEELAVMFQELPAEKVVNFIRHTLGPKVERRLRSHHAELLEENRQDLLRSGTHAHTAQPQARPSAPRYEQYTRKGIGQGQRLGLDAAANAIMAGMIDDDE